MKKLLGIIAIAAVAAAAGWNFNQSQNEVEMSELGLANVEALAWGEGTNDPNEGSGMKSTECKKNGRITGAKCEPAGPGDKCHYIREQWGNCD